MADILIVDDSATMRKIIQRAIRKIGLDVGTIHEADNGVNGLKVLEGNAVDLIVCDVNMPEMNGLEFVKAVRADKPEKPPIIMVTTEGSADMIQQASSLGANGHVKKPFTPEDLESVVTKVMS